MFIIAYNISTDGGWQGQRIFVPAEPNVTVSLWPMTIWPLRLEMVAVDDDG